MFYVILSRPGGMVAIRVSHASLTHRDLDALRAMVREAVVCHFDEGERARLVRLHLVRDELIAV